MRQLAQLSRALGANTHVRGCQFLYAVNVLAIPADVAKRLGASRVTAIQALAGNTTQGVTSRYMHLSPAAKDDAIRLLDRPVSKALVEAGLEAHPSPEGEPPGRGNILETLATRKPARPLASERAGGGPYGRRPPAGR
jgi:hypothetical protein